MIRGKDGILARIAKEIPRELAKLIMVDHKIIKEISHLFDIPY